MLDGDCGADGSFGWTGSGEGTGRDSEALLEMAPRQRLFYRAELWRYAEEAGGLSLAALTNPIYISAQ
ncbi:hypothetical protein D3C75_1364750 [compost metagenome]